MKAMEKEAQVTDMETIVIAAFSCVTVIDCNQWIQDSAVYCQLMYDLYYVSVTSSNFDHMNAIQQHQYIVIKINCEFDR